MLEPIYIKPKEVISKQFLQELKEINSRYTKNKKFFQYQHSIKKLFKLEDISKIKRETFFYLAGFLESESSLTFTIKKNQTSKFGVYFNFEFNLTQHINGISNLVLAMEVFKTGRIHFKSGSCATFVYTIYNRRSLEEKIIPFYEKFVIPYGSYAKAIRVKKFKEIFQLFKEKAHLDINRIIIDILPL